MNRQSLWAIGAATVAAFGLLVWWQGATKLPTTSVAPPPADAAQTQSPPAGVKRADAQLTVPLSAEDQAFIAGLRDKFGRAIQAKHVQIRVIEQLIAYLQQRYPEDWQTRVQGFLVQLFPELASALFAQFEKLMSYTDWLKANRAEMSRLPAAERRQALWDARRATFGADADEIWQAELRNEKVVEVLAALDQAHGKSTDEKMNQFLDALDQTYGEQAPLFIERSRTELLNRFLAVNSVQTELASLPRPEQHAALRRVRTALGMDEAALQRWEELDSKRDQAWDAGQSYQLQRDALIAQYSGAEQSRRLAALQDQLLGAEAETIRAEEAAGFFRYAQTRRLGRE